MVPVRFVFLVGAFGLVNYIPPIGIPPEQTLFSDHYQVPLRPRDGYIEATCVFYEAKGLAADASEDNDIFLGALEGIDSGHLDLFKGLVS